MGTNGMSGRGEGAGEARLASSIGFLVERSLGRTPIEVRAYVHDNLIVCVLDGLTSNGEQRLAADQGQTAVRGARRLLHDSLREEALAEIERLSGRRVISYLNDSDTAADHVALVFVLEPLAVDGDGRPPQVTEWGSRIG
jgi:uncharacterized protein YbcI